ncbi:MAG TPA: hypothetical protein VIK94_02960 [Bacilli bacterium]
MDDEKYQINYQKLDGLKRQPKKSKKDLIFTVGFEKPVSIWMWLLVIGIPIIISLIPIVGPYLSLILLLGLAFYFDLPKNVKNYAKAMVIINLFFFLIMIIDMIVRREL